MKKTVFLALISVLILACGQSGNKSAKNDQPAADVTEQAKVTVYYFHGKQRCKTCMAIENVAKQTVSGNFADDPGVQFKEIDFSLKENEALAEKYEISFSSLLIATPSDFKDLTDDAFATAVNAPETLAQNIKTTVEEFLVKSPAGNALY